MKSRPADRLARTLFSIAQRILPAERREWADAMRAEFDYLPAGAALSWASGCLVAAIKSRLIPMQTGTFRINRWVMLVETLGCFGPALLAWYEFTFGPSGVVRLNAEIIDKYFMSTPGGGAVLGLMLGFAVTGLIAPIGMFLGLRYALRNAALANRRLGWALIAAPVTQCIAGIIAGVWMETGGWGTGLQLFVLCTLLPVLGILHLMYLAGPVAPPREAAIA